MNDPANPTMNRSSGSVITPPGNGAPIYLDVGAESERRRIAVRVRAGAMPGIFWLGGLNSDMKGTKATALDQWAATQGRAFVRFDYSGHGESDGAFAEGTIGRWLAEARAVFDAFCRGPHVVVGSSMGGWMALLLARDLLARPSEQRAASLAGMVLIAPAPDFTEDLMWAQMAPDVRATLMRDGFWQMPSDYSAEPYIITRALIEEGRNHRILEGTLNTGCPVRILQGAQDPDVPWQHAMKLVAHLPADDVVLTLIQDGDHRLSRPQDIARILAAVDELSSRS